MKVNTIYKYAPVSSAISELKIHGFTIDFNLQAQVEKFESGEYKGDDFMIVEVYRYEGETDPADEAVVYGLESRNGLKGYLLNGFGIGSNPKANFIMSLLKVY